MDNINNIINGIAEKSVKNIAFNDDDYIADDGLMHCGKCHSKKEVIIDMLGELIKPRCLCKCEAAKKEDERKALLLAEKIEFLQKNCFDDDNMLNWTFAADDGKSEYLSKIAKNYAEQFDTFKADGKGLLLYGTVGNGKSFASACIANFLIQNGVPCRMTNFARISAEIGFGEDKKRYLDKLSRYDLLILDDLSAERKTEFMQEIVFEVIDCRYRANKPIIITTNLTADEMTKTEELTQQRVFSRLFEMTIPIEVQGTDRRREKLNNDYKKYKIMLGG